MFTTCAHDLVQSQRRSRKDGKCEEIIGLRVTDKAVDADDNAEPKRWHEGLVVWLPMLFAGFDCDTNLMIA